LPKSNRDRSSARANRHVARRRSPTQRDEGFLFDLVERTRPVFLLVLDQIQDPHNLGACMRTANAAGIHAVVAPADRSAPLSETVRRIACGGADYTPYVQVTNLARTMETLKNAGVWCVGTDDNAEQIIYDVDLTGPLAIVVGSEGTGLRRLTKDQCDFLVQVPMSGRVECLNVSVAAGVCLFEAVRQRQLRPQTK
jgi:23S rRNA (guanosine2251-2'-O)-methyltransferase